MLPLPLPGLPQALDSRIYTPICSLDNSVPTSLNVFPCRPPAITTSSGVSSSRAGASSISHRAGGPCSMGCRNLVSADIVIRQIISDILAVGVCHGLGLCRGQQSLNASYAPEGTRINIRGTRLRSENPCALIGRLGFPLQSVGALRMQATFKAAVQQLSDFSLLESDDTIA